MSNEWKKLEKSAEKGPTSFLIRIVVILFVVSCVGGGLAYVGGWFSESAQVVKEEFGPRAMLQKYEWFKDAAAQLDAKKASIKVYEGRITQLEADYEGTARKDWDRTDKENMNLWRQEVAGLKASYNNLAAQYNSGMAKFNWSFAKAGELPPGATDPLPGEGAYAPYITE